MEENMRHLIQGMASTQTQLSDMKELLTSNQTRIVQLENQVSGLGGEVKQLKELVNLREQQACNPNCPHPGPTGNRGRGQRP
jgi:vacuolar-type H+-ATPase subunit D/Vma8